MRETDHGPAAAGGATPVTATAYRRYAGPLRRNRFTAWWPISRTELRTRVLRWRFLPVFLIALGPFFFREAILYARFVIAPVRVGVMDEMTRGMGRFLRWDRLDFYSDYLEDGFLWLVLLVVAAVLGVPAVPRDRRASAFEIYFARALGRLDYVIGKFIAVFLVLFTLTGGGVLVLFATTALLGPEGAFVGDHIGWLVPLVSYAALLSGFLTLLALAFGTLSENGLVLAGAWLGLFFFAFAVARVLRVAQPGGELDWIDPRRLLLAASAVIHGHPVMSAFPVWVAFLGLALLAGAALLQLGRFLRGRTEGIG